MLSFSRFWPHLLLLAGACLPLGRVLLDPLATLPGSEASDVYKHAWPYWHTLAQIADGSWPSTSLINAPDGGLLLDVMVLPSLIMAPVTLVAGPVLATNLWVLLSLWAVGLASYALGRQLSGSRLGGVTAGLLLQSCPFLMGYALTSGVHERLSLWIFPLLVLGMLRLRQGGGWRWPLLLVGGLLLCTSQCPTFGLFSALLLLLLSPLAVRRWGAYEPGQLPRMVAALAGMAAVMIGTYEVYRWFVTQPEFLAGIPALRVEPTLGINAQLPERQAANLASLFSPMAVRQSAPIRIDDELWRLVYVGWVPLLAMIAGAVLAWQQRRRVVVAVLGLGLLFLLLSLGARVNAGGETVSNPAYHLVALFLPFYGGIPPVWQQAGVFVALGTVAVATLVGAFSRRPLRIAVATVVVAGALAERAWVLPVPLVLDTAPASIPAAYDRARAGTPGGLVDIPRMFAGTRVARGYTFLAQTRHGRPIPVAINLGIARYDAYRPVAQGLADDWSRAAACLRRGRIRWVVLHPPWYETRGDLETAVAGLSAAVGPPAQQDPRTVMFDLSRLQPAAGSRDPGCPRTSGRRRRPAEPR